ncbi:MAG: Trk system potassium transporter TrkA [Clostridiales bacterium]|nr:Trk system potassium transporter TrkA [Candidatus Equinaster intestinalis]
MKIVVIGCGKIGTAVIKSLLDEGHDIVAMDDNAAVVEEVTNIYDVFAFCGSGTDCDALIEAGVAEADVVMAFTGSDEFNMLSCFLSQSLGAAYTVARIRNPEYHSKRLDFIKQQLNISLIVNPELLVAKELANVLKLPTAAGVETFSRGKFEMAEIVIKEDSPLNGMSLMELKKKYPDNFLISAVSRGEEVFIPDGNFVLQSGDKIGITANSSDIVKIFRTLKFETKKARNIMIIGATTTSYYLSKLLMSSGNTVKIIDADLERCKQFSEILPEAVIINGDAAHEEILREEGIKEVDAFVSLTGMDEQNILLSYFAKLEEVPKVVLKVKRTEFIRTAHNLGLDSIASARKTTADIIAGFVRALHNSIGSKVETLYKLMDGKAEALEFIALPDCSILGIPLKNLTTKENTLVAGIIRGGKTIIPTGEDAIMADDRVVVLTSGHTFDDLSEIVKR